MYILVQPTCTPVTSKLPGMDALPEVTLADVEDLFSQQNKLRTEPYPPVKPSPNADMATWPFTLQMYTKMLEDKGRVVGRDGYTGPSNSFFEYRVILSYYHFWGIGCVGGALVGRVA